MADQLKQGDDAINNSAGESASVSEKATDGFFKELFSERDKNMKNSLPEGKEKLSSSGAVADGASAIMSNVIREAKPVKPNASGAASGIAEGISNAIREAKPVKPGASGDAAGIAEGIANAIREAKPVKPGASGDAAGIAEGIANAIRDGKERPHNSKEDLSTDAIKKAIEGIKHSDRSDNIKNVLENFFKPDGVKKLPTGDHLVREDGKESLFTPNGDRVTVNPDGTHVIKGDVKSVTRDKTGATTVTFGDGATVTFDKEGIRDVTRGKESVSFPRWDRQKPQPWDGDKPVKPLPWDGDKPVKPQQWDGGKPVKPLPWDGKKPVDSVLPNLEIKKN